MQTSGSTVHRGGADGTAEGGQAETLRCEGLLQLAPQQRLGVCQEVRLCLVAPQSSAR